MLEFWLKCCMPLTFIGRLFHPDHEQPKFLSTNLSILFKDGGVQMSIQRCVFVDDILHLSLAM